MIGQWLVMFLNCLMTLYQLHNLYSIKWEMNVNELRRMYIEAAYFKVVIQHLLGTEHSSNKPHNNEPLDREWNLPKTKQEY
jgi:hypothetical protein